MHRKKDITIKKIKDYESICSKNSCSVEVFENLADARKWASKEIDGYAADFTDAEVQKVDDWYRMSSGDSYVTIEIVETEIHKG